MKKLLLIITFGLIASDSEHSDSSQKRQKRIERNKELALGIRSLESGINREYNSEDSLEKENTCNNDENRKRRNGVSEVRLTTKGIEKPAIFSPNELCKLNDDLNLANGRRSAFLPLSPATSIFVSRSNVKSMTSLPSPVLPKVRSKSVPLRKEEDFDAEVSSATTSILGGQAVESFCEAISYEDLRASMNNSISSRFLEKDDEEYDADDEDDDTNGEL